MLGMRPFTLPIPDAGLSVQFPRKPTEEDLSLFLIDPARPGADNRTAAVRRYTAEVGTIWGWTATDAGYRYGIRVHVPKPEFAERAKAQAVALIESPANIGHEVTNLVVLDEARGMAGDHKARVVLVERADGQRVLTLLFEVDGRMVFLFVERDVATSLPSGQMVLFFLALVVAFGFEFINGFHDTANAVTTVIYTRTLLPARTAVACSGSLNFLGVLSRGTAVAFAVVNLLPVDLLVGTAPGASLITVLALLFAGAIWNLGTWYLGLPVSSSHTLIGAILGVGIASGRLAGNGLTGWNWAEAGIVGIALFFPR